ncbi:MAG TPA: hydrogen gas-evolving membrane-bound hydrogenase subunit E [Opitutales bacterium]|nr:hydrogen gas-evolving membrane-bound hydrogenase subunit E [Opitutales bacterium]
MFYATMFLPPRGDAEAPLHREVSPTGGLVAGAYYIENARKDAATDNIVTVVLADYRGFDTFGEVMVIFSAAIACAFVLGKSKKDRIRT